MTRRTVSFPSGTRPVRNTLESIVEKTAFWGSVLLPLSYLPVLYVEIDQRLVVLFGLVALNLACLVVGRDYARES